MSQCEDVGPPFGLEWSRSGSDGVLRSSRGVCTRVRACVVLTTATS